MGPSVIVTYFGCTLSWFPSRQSYLLSLIQILFENKSIILFHQKKKDNILLSVVKVVFQPGGAHKL